MTRFHQLSRPRRLGAWLLLSAVALTAAACGSDSDPTAPTDVTGSYTLVTLNGAPIPALWGVFTEDGFDFQVYVTTSSLVVRADQTASFSATAEFRLGGVVIDTERFDEEGTWQLVGSEFRVTLDGETIIGTVEGRTLTLQVPPDGTIPASTWVYER
jgi:hypothetical protein